MSTLPTIGVALGVPVGIIVIAGVAGYVAYSIFGKAKIMSVLNLGQTVTANAGFRVKITETGALFSGGGANGMPSGNCTTLAFHGKSLGNSLTCHGWEPLPQQSPTKQISSSAFKSIQNVAQDTAVNYVQFQAM